MRLNYSLRRSLKAVLTIRISYPHPVVDPAVNASRCCRSINFLIYYAPLLLLLLFPPSNFLLPSPSNSVCLYVKSPHERSRANVAEAAGALLRWHRFVIHSRITKRADSLSGNKFLGNDSDTNIVKIYKMFDRKCPNQYHYYQRNSP